MKRSELKALNEILTEKILERYIQSLINLRRFCKARTNFVKDENNVLIAGRYYISTVYTGPGAHPASYQIGTESFQGVKSGRGVTLTPHPF
jgi:hypothetical protein